MTRRGFPEYSLDPDTMEIRVSEFQPAAFLPTMPLTLWQRFVNWWMGR